MQQANHIEVTAAGAVTEAAWRRPTRSVPALAVLLVHGALLLAWIGSLTPRLRGPVVAEAKAPLIARNVALLPPVPAPATAPAPSALPAPRARPPSSVARPPPIAAAPMSVLAVDATTATPEPPVPVALPTDPKASAPLQLALPTSPRGTSMQGRGALTEAQASMRQLALNDPRSNQKIDPLQKLPDAVASAGKGDCVKGEFMGGGMGLLSAPFLALAAATGHCTPLR